MDRYSRRLRAPISPWYGVAIIVIGALLAACIVLWPAPARADENAKLANELLLVQAADVLTTRSAITHGGYEGDPIAKPFAQNTFALSGAALGINGALRLILHKPDEWRFAIGVECMVSANNVMVIWNLTSRRP